MSDPNAPQTDQPDFMIDINPDIKPFEPVPEGTYILIIHPEDVTMNQKTPSGFPSIKIAHTVVKPDEHAGRKIYMNYTLKPDAQWRIQQLCLATIGEWRPFKLPELCGVQHSAVVRNEDYQGTPQNKIKSFSKIQ